MAVFLKPLKVRHHTYPTHMTRVPDERGIRKMASPSKHVLFLTVDRRQMV